MLEINFAPSIVKDVLLTQEYDLQGVAEYVGFHEDVVIDIVLGKNRYPSAIFLKRIIELHRSVRSELYETIVKKIAVQLSSIVV